MKPPPRWVLSHHAVARYIERIEPGADRAHVEGYLNGVSRRAHFVGTRDGARLYRDPTYPMRAEFVVKGRVLVTVTDPTVQTMDRRRICVARGR